MSGIRPHSTVFFCNDLVRIIFALLVTFSLASGQDQLQVQELDDESGTVVSPDYPKKIRYAQYRWIIRSSGTKTITVRVDEFDVPDLFSADCSRSYLHLFDGRDKQRSKDSICSYKGTNEDLGKFRFCNRARPSAYVSVDTDTLFIEYCTGKVAGKGFTLTYATDQSEHFPTDPSSTSSSTSSAPDNTTESNVTAVTNTSSAGTTVTIATTTVKPPRPTRPPTGPVQCSMNPKSQDYCGCGRQAYRPATFRIVGGKEALPHTWPWVVHLYRNYGGEWHGMCGGSLIDEYTVVTAAHCVDGHLNPKLYRARLGDHARTETEAAQVDHDVEDIIMHPDYQNWDMDNDVAVIKLKKKATLRNEINTVCLPRERPTPKGGSRVVVVGWGESLVQSNRRNGNSSNFETQAENISDAEAVADEDSRRADVRAASAVLNQANVRIIPREVCQKPDYYHYQITENMICAGHDEGSMDACQGDSGGPLVQKRYGRYELVGLVSWGEGCGIAKKPGVYTDVVNYLDWIQEHSSNLKT